MSEPIVAVERLGKKYRIQHNQARQPYIALRDVIAQKLSAPMRWFRNGAKDAIPAEEDFWALKDVSFDVAEGDVVGIIGRNGAGKSTLLKVLSRITDPTEGRVTLRGRAGSLLEVGTGFHPELTGRDNIFLNGAILGMPRAEITRKFDEIVAFSGVERFLDTPVKRYSSGMHVRLAFAVAAHLEPEILIVDEVLSVGDAEFQQKCLGKMGEVAKSGRTVLFVSHHLATVENLCKTCILLERGRVKVQGPAHQVIAVYASDTSGAGQQSILDRTDRRGNGVVRFSAARLLNEAGQPINAFKSGQTGIFELQVTNPTGGPVRSFHVSVGVDNLFGQRVTTWSSAYTNGDFQSTPSGNFAVRITLPRLALIPGQYTYNLFAMVSGDVADWLLPGGSFEVEAGDFYGSGQLPESEDGAYIERTRDFIAMKGRGFVKRLAMWPLSVVSEDLRAEALELMSSTSTADAHMPGATLTFFAPTPLLRQRADTLLTKEPDMIAWLQQLPPDAVLWDIGANVGVFSLYAAATRKCSVLSFEPSAANFYVLTRNIQLNHLEARVSAYCVALSGETKLGVLNLDSAALGGSMTQFGQAGEISRYSTGGHALSHGMVGMTIDEFVKRFAPPFPTHVKMDVDGLELAILEGASSTLRDSRITSAMVELSLSNPAERDRAIAVLAAAGLHLVSQGESQGNAGESAANHLFMRR